MGSQWQVQEAKNRFSEMIERANLEGPQVITRHGRVVARVIAATTSQSAALTVPNGESFANYLLAAPKIDGLELPIRRSRKSAVQLG